MAAKSEGQAFWEFGKDGRIEGQLLWSFQVSVNQNDRTGRLRTALYGDHQLALLQATPQDLQRKKNHLILPLYY